MRAERRDNLECLLPSSITGAVQPYVDRGELAGAVMLVADRTRVLGLGAVGLADLATRKPMEPDSLFWIASQTKSITATALMMLVDEGKVRLDDPVSAYLPEFRDQWLVASVDDEQMQLRKPRQPLLVRHLLNHTSGMPFASAVEQPTRDRLPLRQAVRSYALTPLEAEPGTRYLYSNAGINTAGAIIEELGGLPYEAFLQQRLFDPLNLKDTTFWPTRAQQARLARAYKPNADQTALEETGIEQLSHPLDDPRRQPMPGGGLFSTALDVGRFCQMILNKGTWDGRRYVSESAVAEMTRRQLPDSMSQKYGLGWGVDSEAFGHGGALNTSMEVYPGDGRVYIYLIQSAGFLGGGGGGRESFTRAAREWARHTIQR